MTALAFGIPWLGSGSGSLAWVVLLNKYAAEPWRLVSWTQCEHGIILAFFGSEITPGPYWMVLEEYLKALGALTLISSNKLPLGSQLLNWITKSWIPFLIVLVET